MKNLKIAATSLGAVLLAVGFLALIGGATTFAQEGPAVIGDLALVKYVCPSDIGENGATIPAGCVDANDPNGADVPVIPVAGSVSFLYRVTYSCPPSVVCEPLNPISVTISDNQLPSTVPSVFGPLNDANNNNLLDPGDVWLYKVRGLSAIDLAQPGVTLPGGGPVAGCANAGDGAGSRPTYVNRARVTGPSTSDEDPAAYCNPPATPTPTATVVQPTPTDTPTSTPTQVIVTPIITPTPGPTPTPVPVPEPVTVVLFGAGLAALSAALAARRRSGNK
ncbi:MAG: PEP-CTERM sorting domain-containing protein [Caldilinea sp.]|nr:PEP-CTERM sorting domain-containing protein [Caldilinea sp.]MDW8439755.1 PEP-CTERM sorting domain-containing protein [Caldilineaceae bacterium]